MRSTTPPFCSWILCGWSLAAIGMLFCRTDSGQADDVKSERPAAESILPVNAEEARIRARLIHELVHGALQVMHRDFFNADKSANIPSRSLEDVFDSLQESYQVKIRWIAVNATAMSTDNTPRGSFELEAVKALAAGKAEFEEVNEKTYSFAGKIPLGSSCLKCHVPNRTSVRDRTAGLAIIMPLKKP